MHATTIHKHNQTLSRAAAALLAAFSVFTSFAQTPSGNWSDVRDTAWPGPANTLENGTLLTIDTPEQLAQFAWLITQGNDVFEHKTVMLNTNLNLSARYWTPAGSALSNSARTFMGTFDGNGRTLVGLGIDGRPTTSAYYGLFSILQRRAVVRNLRMENVSIEILGAGELRVGAIAGGIIGQNSTYPASVTIENCVVAGGFLSLDATSAAGVLGGIIGDMGNDGNFSSSQPCVLRNCANHAEVRLRIRTPNLTPMVGGLIGRSRYILVANNVNTAPVTITSDSSTAMSCNIGGICGYSGTQTALRNCFNTGLLSFNAALYNTPAHGGIAATHQGSAASVYFLGANTPAPVPNNRAFNSTSLSGGFAVINPGPGLLSPTPNFGTNSPVAALNAWTVQENTTLGTGTYRSWTLQPGVNHDYPVLEPAVDVWANLDYNGATGGVTIGAKQVTLGLVYGQLPVPSMQNCLFAGWFTDPADAEPAIDLWSPVTLASDHTLYAKWTFDTAFDSNYGNSAPTTLAQTVGASFNLPPLTRPGYDFAGWFPNANGTGTKVTAATLADAASPRLLYAQWTSRPGILILPNGNGFITIIQPPGIIIISSGEDPFTGQIFLPGMDGVSNTPDDITFSNGTCDPDTFYVTVNSGPVTDRNNIPLSDRHGNPVTIPSGSIVTHDGVVLIPPAFPGEPLVVLPDGNVLLSEGTQVWTFIPPLLNALDPSPSGTVYDPDLYALHISGEPDPLPIPDTFSIPLITRIELLPADNSHTIWIQAAHCDSPKRMGYTIVGADALGKPFREIQGIQRLDRADLTPSGHLDFFFPIPTSNLHFFRVKAVLPFF